MAEEDTEGQDSNPNEFENESPPKSQRLSYEDSVRVLGETDASKRVERLGVITGNSMIDQFQPWYFGVAFAFLFKFCTGMPDMPAFAKRVRYRRTVDAPRIEPSLWIKVLSRRVEASLSRDWTFGFVS